MISPQLPSLTKINQFMLKFNCHLLKLLNSHSQFRYPESPRDSSSSFIIFSRSRLFVNIVKSNVLDVKMKLFSLNEEFCIHNSVAERETSSQFVCSEKLKIHAKMLSEIVRLANGTYKTTFENFIHESSLTIFEEVVSALLFLNLIFTVL